MASSPARDRHESFDLFTEPRAVTVNTTGETLDGYDDSGAPKRLN